MCGDIARADTPFVDAFARITVQYAARNVVLGVGDIDVAVSGVDGNAVGNHDIELCAVGDEFARYDTLFLDVDDGVGYRVFRGLVAVLDTVDIKGIPEMIMFEAGMFIASATW